MEGMAAPRLPVADYRAFAEFRYQLRRFMSFSEEAARSAGLEPQQHQLLLGVKGLSRDQPATIGALADWLHLRHHSMVELVDRTEARGLVRRERAEGDRRQGLGRLTPRGESLLSRLALVHRAELRIVGPALLGALRTLEVAPTGRVRLALVRNGHRTARAGQGR